LAHIAAAAIGLKGTSNAKILTDREIAAIEGHGGPHLVMNNSIG
jgi:hypothetical protein